MRPGAGGPTLAGVAALLCATTSIAVGADLDGAAASARRIDTVRGAIVSAMQHGEERTDDLILEATSAWRPRYDRFARSSAARSLRAYAGAQARRASISPEACGRLKPLAALARSAERVAAAGGKVASGHVLVRCKEGPCAPPAVPSIETLCRFEPFATPLQPS